MTEVGRTPPMERSSAHYDSEVAGGSGPWQHRSSMGAGWVGDLALRWGSASDVGRVRSVNEDACGFWSGTDVCFCVLSDGAGGHVGAPQSVSPAEPEQAIALQT